MPSRDPIPNDIARDAEPTLFIFEGKSVIYLIVGVGFAIATFNVLKRLGWDLISNTVASSVWIAMAFLFVLTMVNGKPERYVFDAILWALFQVKVALYRWGISSRPPQVWIPVPPPPHPSTFSRKE